MKSGWQVLPPGKGKCRSCAVEHELEQPHDATSLYYQMLFCQQYGRSPTWADAMAHCSQEKQEAWTKLLNKAGIDVHSTRVRGGIKTEEELRERLGGDRK